MAKKKIISNKKETSKGGREKYVLRLFVTALSPNSIKAIVNVKKICEEYLKDNYELEIIDMTLNPKIAIKEQILVVPMLLKKYPLPETRMIGDLSNTAKVLDGLHIIKNDIQ